MLQYWRVFALAAGIAAFGGYQAWGTFSNKGYAPEQPIPFSHLLHAGVLKINCLYCHSSAEKSAHAGIPPMNTCMGCHSIVKTDSPYIQKLTQAYNEGKPIEWVRIHHTPDHAHFSHRWHVAAGVSCQECHGPVEKMTVVQQWRKLEMKDCMDCHRAGNYLDTIHHPPTYPDGAEESVTPAMLAEAKSDTETWQSVRALTAKYHPEGAPPDEREVALNVFAAKDLYYHGRGAQLRGVNASVECTICHH